VLIVDEVSMLHGSLLDKLDVIAKCVAPSPTAPLT
jgi:hypothetical protein